MSGGDGTQFRAYFRRMGPRSWTIGAHRISADDTPATWQDTAKGYRTPGGYVSAVGATREAAYRALRQVVAARGMSKVVARIDEYLRQIYEESPEGRAEAQARRDTYRLGKEAMSGVATRMARITALAQAVDIETASPEVRALLNELASLQHYPWALVALYFAPPGEKESPKT